MQQQYTTGWGLKGLNFLSHNKEERKVKLFFPSLCRCDIVIKSSVISVRICYFFSSFFGSWWCVYPLSLLVLTFVLPPSSTLHQSTESVSNTLLALTVKCNSTPPPPPLHR